jgi:transcriptional antiterminator RfaH
VIGSSSSSMDKEWYAVYTVVRHEKAVNSALAEKDIETFLPLREVVHQWRNRRKKAQLPLSPRYLFVNVFLQDSWSVLNILSTRSVVRILGTNGTPVPIPAEQIDGVKKLLESKLKYYPYPYFNEGRDIV